MKPYKEKYEYMASLMTVDNSSKEKTREDLKGELGKKKSHIKEIESELRKVENIKSEFKMKSP